MFCKNCGNQVSDNAAACLNCGANPKKGSNYCQNCGEQVNEHQVICLKCGASLKEEEKKSEAATPNYNGMPAINIVNTNTNTNNNNNAVNMMPRGEAKKKWVAFALCILLGWLGIHKFYEGKVGMGILYAITGGLCFIGVIIDAIVILGHTDPYYV